MKPVIVLGVLVVGLIIAGGIAKAFRPAPPGSLAVPKSNCELPEDLHPTHLFALVSSKKDEYQSAYTSMIGCMVPASGWEGQVTSVSGNTLHFEVGTGIGSYSIHVLMREPPAVQPGSVVRYRGRLDGATAKIVRGNTMNRIELSDGEFVR